jgi:predicted nucleic acid-binding protein
VIVYLDTSTVLRVVLEQGRRLASWGRWEEACSSELCGVEARRVIDRLRLDGVLDDAGVVAAQKGLLQVERGIRRILLTRAVLRRASLPMATVVKTLDAIHLASALLLQEHRGTAVVFATHDTRQARAARALGFECAER